MSTKDQILITTCELLEAQGYHATGLNQILTESGAPKGSLYYYFPEGKEELVAEAIKRTGTLLATRVRAGLSHDGEVAEVFKRFFEIVANAVENSGFRAGGPLTTVALETVNLSPRLNLACREAYQRVEGAFVEKLLASGYNEERSQQLATMIMAALEGGILLSRTHHSGDALRRVAATLESLLKMMPAQ